MPLLLEVVVAEGNAPATTYWRACLVLVVVVVLVRLLLLLWVLIRGESVSL